MYSDKLGDIRKDFITHMSKKHAKDYAKRKHGKRFIIKNIITTRRATKNKAGEYTAILKFK